MTQKENLSGMELFLMCFGGIAAKFGPGCFSPAG